MAVISTDKKSVRVTSGDTLSSILSTLKSKGIVSQSTTVNDLAKWNKISNPNNISVGQIIYTSSSAAGSSSSSSSGTTAKTSAVTTVPKIIFFGTESGDDNTLVAFWQWDKKNTDKYHVIWEYDVGDSHWYQGAVSDNTVDPLAPHLARQSTYSIPSNPKLRQIRFYVYAIAKTYTENKNERKYWSDAKSAYKIYTPSGSQSSEQPEAPEVSIEGTRLIAQIQLENWDGNTTKRKAQFRISKIGPDENATDKGNLAVKNRTQNFHESAEWDVPYTGIFLYNYTVPTGYKYVVQVRIKYGSTFSPWSEVSNEVESAPNPPSNPRAKILAKRDDDETYYAVQFSWKTGGSAVDHYVIEWTTDPRLSDSWTEETTVDSKTTYVKQFDIGQEDILYTFRIKSVGGGESPQESAYSEQSTFTIRKDPVKPNAPTTWSVPSSVTTFDDVYDNSKAVRMYWINNSPDGTAALETRIKADVRIEGQSTISIPEYVIDHKQYGTFDADPEVTYYRMIQNALPDGYNLRNYEQYGGISYDWKMRVKTTGSGTQYSDYSTTRTMSIYVAPSFTLRLYRKKVVLEYDPNDYYNTGDIVIQNGNYYMSTTDNNDFDLDSIFWVTPDEEDFIVNLDPNNTIVSFPFYLRIVPNPVAPMQYPVGYTVSIISTEPYETFDAAGNTQTISTNESIFSKYLPAKLTSAPTSVLTDTYYDEYEFMPEDIDLESNVTYSVSVTMATSVGLTCENSTTFFVNWVEVPYVPNADIAISQDDYSASIRPYCTYEFIRYFQVNNTNNHWIVDFDGGEIGMAVFGELVPGAETDPAEEDEQGNPYVGGDPVYRVLLAGGGANYMYYSEIRNDDLVSNVKLSIFRREFDGRFTEIISGLDNDGTNYVTDPHPSLDYARYRIVSIDQRNGAVAYSDLPSYPVNGKEIIIQWDERWTNYNYTETSGDAYAQPFNYGSMLKLPFNIDVSDNYDKQTSLVEYVGRSHPVSYYGTQLGESSTWNVDIDKQDKETLYAIRRLAAWTGDVYVREPSGTGYWATVKVSYGVKHLDLVVPISFTISRVEGGV